MHKEEIAFSFEVYDSVDDLQLEDKTLLESARQVTAKAYAPYSSFLVGATALLINGETVSGTNQENASYPVGICAERSLLATAAMLHTNVAIKSMAIAYHHLNGKSESPVSPCGMCRQSLLEYEQRMQHPIRILLSGMSGSVYVIASAAQFLPLFFGSSDLK